MLGGTPLSAREPRTNSSLKAAGLEVAVSPKQRMKLGRDVVPDVPASGKPGNRDLQAKGLSPEVVLASPRTPDLGEVRMRHRRRVDPGQITVHWGHRKLNIPEAGEGYGQKSQKGETVARTLRAAEVVGVAEYLNTCGERVYKSTVDEPLGKMRLRGHQHPQETLEGDFVGFGKATPSGPFTAKESIFPCDVDPQNEDVKALCQRYHGDSEPGEMLRRGYVWPNAITRDPHFQFGARALDGRAGHGVKGALSAHLLDATGNFPATQLVNHSSECYQQVTADPLSGRRNLFQGSPKVPPSHTYGLRSSKDALPLAEIISGSYREDECLPDKDLGHCTVQGRRNFMTELPLGAPTVRSDKVAPAFEKRSVANSTNYGDDIGAYGLLFPDKWRASGLTKEDFQMRRSREELLGVLSGAGVPMDPVAFEPVFFAACSMYGDGDLRASLDAISITYAQQEFGTNSHQ